MLPLLVALLLSACSGGAAGDSGPRNLLLVTFDTTRADHLGAYGYPHAITPTLDRLANEGVRFTTCIAPAPITLPAHASLLTGLRPLKHGARNNATHPLPLDVPTLAERLQAAGFNTSAVVSAFVLDSRYGLARGFDSYDDDLTSALAAKDFMIKETKADNTAGRAITWLKSKSDDQAWFLWVHFFDPHASYEAPEKYASNHPGSSYDAEITFADAQLGRILKQLEQQQQLDDTLVVMTADHGESLGEHGEQTHGFFIYDATTHVPLIFNHSSLTKQVIEQVCGSVDVAPSVCALLGVDYTPSDFDGVDLFSQIDSREPVYQESMVPYFNHGWSDLRALRGQHSRFIKAPVSELEVISKTNPIDEKLSSKLSQLLAEGERGLELGGLSEMSEAERRTMEELGYIWDDGGLENGDQLNPKSLADPKDKVVEWEKNQQIYELVRQEKWTEAERTLRELIKSAPAALDSRKILARVLTATGRSQEAHEELVSASKLPAADAELFVRLAESAFALKLDWQNYLNEARRRNPSDPSPWVMEGDWSLKLRDLEKAMSAYSQAIELDQSCAEAWSGRGRLLHMGGQKAASASALDRALVLDPSLATAWFGRGVVEMAGGDPGKAQGFFLKAIELKPDYANAYANLGSIYFRQQRLDEAATSWLKALEINPNHQQAKRNMELLEK